MKQKRIDLRNKCETLRPTLNVPLLMLYISCASKSNEKNDFYGTLPQPRIHAIPDHIGAFIYRYLYLLLGGKSANVCSTPTSSTNKSRFSPDRSTRSQCEQLSKLLDRIVLHSWGSEHTNMRFLRSWAVWTNSERGARESSLTCVPTISVCVQLVTVNESVLDHQD